MSKTMSEGQFIANAIDHYSRPTTRFPKPPQPSTFSKVSSGLSVAASNLLSSAQNARTGTFVFLVTIHDFRDTEQGSRTVGVFNDRNIARKALDGALGEKRYTGARIWRRDVDEGGDGRREAVGRGHVHDVVGVVGRMRVRGSVAENA